MAKKSYSNKANFFCAELFSSLNLDVFAVSSQTGFALDHSQVWGVENLKTERAK